MSRAPRILLLIPVLLCAAFSARAEITAPLERGAAIIDPLALRALEQAGNSETGFELRRFIPGARMDKTPIADDELFALPAMAPLRAALDADFDRYAARHHVELPNETIGVGTAFDWQLFDRGLLYSPRARFVLSGIVNRMDRAYVAPESCGEIRLIYRLTRLDDGPVGEGANSPRLPMTLNVVLHARGDKAGAAVTCKEIARRWLGVADWPEAGAALAAKLTAADGPLALVRPDNIDRIETNLQIAHAPKSAVRDFRTDYLLKVFRYDAQARLFQETPMENQIDRERLLADAKLKGEFKAWLLEPKNLRDFDRGAVLIPEPFLAKAAIAPTPAGFDPSELLPEFGLVQGEGTGAGVFDDNDVVSALKKAAQKGVTLQNIRSVAGFERRLNDITCAGCHQTRGIGGFHFPGVDWMAAKPSNSTVVPASPHFFGDQARRRDILAAIAGGSAPDYSRGFSSRPQLRGSNELAGTEYSDGWGAHCYVQHAKGSDNDASFRSWTCAKGLACEAAGQSSRMGMCFIKSR
jgi:hypothetical protein